MAEFEERAEAIREVAKGLTGKRHSVDVLDTGVTNDDEPYLDVTIDDYPYRLILEDHG